MNMMLGVYKKELQKCVDSITEENIEAIFEIFKEAWTNDQTIYVCGNGGSASTASHMVCDLNKGASVEGVRPLRVIGLADNAAHFTALANDHAYDDTFVGQLRNFYRTGDVLVGISASGNSPNCVRAFNYIKTNDGKTVGLLGFTGGKMAEVSDASIILDSSEYGPVEDGHLIINHILTVKMKEWFESMT